MSRGFPEEFRQELLNKTDIVDVVSRYVDLKKKGGKYWGCCPFHNEKTASFNVDVNKQFFYCFGCSKGGDAITFVKEMEHLSYVEAVEYLADKAGLTVPRISNSKFEEEKEKQRKRHYEICKAAAGFYYSMLAKGNNKAADYCTKRGISFGIVKRFGMGYAPPGGDLLFKYLLSLGFTKEETIRSGLAKENSAGGIRDFFFDRLMFPIMDVYGNVIAFGGRVLGEGIPKYLNSSDSPLYNKKRHLYGLNIAKKNKQADRLLLVEGYMDVVTVSSFGIGGAVASLGTSLTKEQCILIKRFTRDVYIAYDGDGAGRKAAVRASKMLMEEGIMPRILVFEEGLDPDEYLKKYGADKFEGLMDNAELPFKFEIDKLSENYDLTKEAGRRDFASAALEVAATIKSELDKEDILKYLEVKTGYSVETLSRQTVKMHKMEKNSHNSTQMTEVPNKDSFKTKAEALAIKLALNGWRERILLELAEDDFDEPAYKECFKEIKDGMISEHDVMSMFDSESMQRMAMKVVAIPDEEVCDTSFKGCIDAIKNEKLKKELDYYESLLKNKELEKEKRIEALEKIPELQRRLKQI